MLGTDLPVTFSFFFGNMVNLFKRTEETVAVIIMSTVTDSANGLINSDQSFECTSIKITFDVVKPHFTASMNFIKNSACYPVNLWRYFVTKPRISSASSRCWQGLHLSFLWMPQLREGGNFILK